jgi:ubiquinone biosynthesis protein UbiJ
VEHLVGQIFFFTMVGVVAVSFSPLGRAVARRLTGEGRPARDDAEVEVLQSDVAQLRRELDEVQNRLDFTERLLAQARERGLLSAPRER